MLLTGKNKGLLKFFWAVGGFLLHTPSGASACAFNSISQIGDLRKAFLVPARSRQFSVLGISKKQGRDFWRFSPRSLPIQAHGVAYSITRNSLFRARKSPPDVSSAYC